MAAKDGPRPPCAACKYQRRRCWPGCTLAPYFPAEKPKMFKNAHRLYGVCNMTRMLRRLRDDQKDDAMKSVIYESDLRQRFPVYGCLGIIRQLQEQLKRYQDELIRVNSLLAAIKLQGQSRNYQWRNQSPGRGVPKKLASQFCLVAEDNEEIVWQSGDGASRSARWEVELVEGKSNAIRLKNCKTWKYLSASDEAFLLGWTGRRVVQASPRMKLDASVEWEPVKEGSHLKLKSLKGKGMFLRANGFTPPWKNSVTHDLPGRTATQDWILWRVDILENDHQNDKSIGKNSPDPGATKAIFTSADEKEKEEAETVSSASSSSSVNSAAYYGSGSPVSVRSVHSSSQITEPVIITRRSTSVDSETAASHWKPKVSSFGRRATSNVSQESSPHSNSFSKLRSVLDDVEKLLDGEAAEVVETNTTAKPPATPNTLEVRMAKETLKEVEDLDFNSVSSSGRLKRLEKAIDILLHSANDHDDQSYSKFVGLQRQIRALKDDHDAASDDLRRYSIFSAERSAVKMELKADTTKARELEIAESECNRVLITAYEKKEELLKQLEEVEKSIEDAEREQAQNTAEIERVISVIAQKSESLREMERRERSWQVSKSLAEKKLLKVEDDWARLKCSFSA